MSTSAAADRRWTTVEGRQMHARVWLDPRVPADPPIVLVHGLGVASPAIQRLVLARHAMPAPLTLRELDTFLEAHGDRYALEVSDVRGQRRVS